MPKKKIKPDNGKQYRIEPTYIGRHDVGRPAVHPPEDCKRLMTRTTEEEYDIWWRAAQREGLTIGPWSRMILNRAARELGIKPPR
jgi:hypothetical protein